MKQYLDLMRRILDEGEEKDDRTGTGTYSLFGPQMEFNLQHGLPLLTTKKMFMKGIIYELLWMLKGDTNVKYLNDHGVHIWDEWADENGDLGPVYGRQWRKWREFQKIKYDKTPEGVPYALPIFKTIDQIADVVHRIKEKPDDRRLIVSAWNVAEIDEMKLPPCHCLFQFYVNNGRWLSCKLYQRSADLFLGVPFNTASYALLLMMVAKVTDMIPYRFIHSFGDVHIYKNHVEQCFEQLRRDPKPLPHMEIKDRGQSIDGFEYSDFNLVGYHPHMPIKAEVSV